MLTFQLCFLNCEMDNHLQNIYRAILKYLIPVNFGLFVITGYQFHFTKNGLFWYQHERTTKKSVQIYGLFLIVFVILIGLWLSA